MLVTSLTLRYAFSALGEHTPPEHVMFCVGSVEMFTAACATPGMIVSTQTIAVSLRGKRSRRGVPLIDGRIVISPRAAIVRRMRRPGTGQRAHQPALAAQNCAPLQGSLTGRLYLLCSTGNIK